MQKRYSTPEMIDEKGDGADVGRRNAHRIPSFRDVIFSKALSTVG